MPERPHIYTSVLLCERILIEKDEVMSAIRLVDVHNIVSVPLGTKTSLEQPPEKGTSPALIEGYLLVIFKAESPCDFTARIALSDPDGKRLLQQDYPVRVGAGVKGHVLRSELAVAVRMPGTYWFDIEIDGLTVQRAPMEIRFLTAQQAELPTQKPEQNPAPSA